MSMQELQQVKSWMGVDKEEITKLIITLATKG